MEILFNVRLFLFSIRQAAIGSGVFYMIEMGKLRGDLGVDQIILVGKPLKRKKGYEIFVTPCFYLARDGRLERPTFGSGGQRSIQLS